MDLTKELPDTNRYTLPMFLDDLRSVLGGILLGLVIVKLLPVYSPLAEWIGAVGGGAAVFFVSRAFHMR